MILNLIEKEPKVPLQYISALFEFSDTVYSESALWTILGYTLGNPVGDPSLRGNGTRKMVGGKWNMCREIGALISLNSIPV